VTPAGRPLPRAFFARPSPVVAPALLGRVLVRRLASGERLAVRIVEAEAYQEDDPASHSYRGRTTRTDVMFGAPGRLYVYFTYGMHFCMNVVTGRDGEGSAVLLRAAEPLEGLPSMRRLRAIDDDRLLCSGPARLCQALGVGRDDNGLDLVRREGMWIGAGSPVGPGRIVRTPRVGIRQGAERPWRFLVAGDAYVSRAAPAAPGAATGSRRS
jgi:DNA-3-methyladenine glycosylase